MIRSVLFVCLGNICRSPAAEGIFRDMVAARGLAVKVDSAGTSDWHVGDPPYGPMQAAARARGVDLSALRGRQVTAEDFHRFDLVIAMDKDNQTNLSRLRPADGAPVHLLLDYAPEAGTEAVPDPYYTRDFEGALDLIEAGCRGLAASIAAGR
jgi:protein-tyrosine phosphatase